MAANKGVVLVVELLVAGSLAILSLAVLADTLRRMCEEKEKRRSQRRNSH